MNHLACRQNIRLLFITIGMRWLSNGLAWAQQVQTGHFAPGWNGALKAGIMASDPGFYMQNTTMFFHASKFKDGSGDTVNDNTTDYVLNALALVWRPDVQLFGADVQAVATPAVGNLSGLPVLVDGQPQDAPVGFTDMFCSPIGLGWHWPEFHIVAALGGFAPTGNFMLGGKVPNLEEIMREAYVRAFQTTLGVLTGIVLAACSWHRLFRAFNPVNRIQYEPKGSQEKPESRRQRSLAVPPGSVIGKMFSLAGIWDRGGHQTRLERGQTGRRRRLVGQDRPECTVS
jgi:hypothetical protein